MDGLPLSGETEQVQFITPGRDQWEATFLGWGGYMANIGPGRIPGCCLTMMFVVLFALLGLFLAGFREGVWTKYTPEDIARWHAAGAPNNSPSLLAHGLARPAKPFVVPVSAAPDVKNDSVPQAA